MMRKKIKMNLDDIKNFSGFMLPAEEEVQALWKNISQKALELFYTDKIDKFVDLYNSEYTSIEDKIDAITILLMAVKEIEDSDLSKILRFRESIVKTEDNNFIYLFDDAMFQAGMITPEEFTQSIEDGIRKNIPMAYVIKSFFYYYGLNDYESSVQAIQNLIILEPNNLEYKEILKSLEEEAENGFPWNEESIDKYR